MRIIEFLHSKKHFPVIKELYKVIKNKLINPLQYYIPEITEINARPTSYAKYRINLLIPSINTIHVFGGISTAIKFFEELRKNCDVDARIIVLDAPIDSSNSINLVNYKLMSAEDESFEHLQIVSFSDRHSKTLAVGLNDIFMATSWWSAYIITSIIEWQKNTYSTALKSLIYFIQDYEPGFYPWSSRYVLAESTYHTNVPTLAIINSSFLADYLDNHNYHFEKSWYFEPVLNYKLKNFLLKSSSKIIKNKVILIYGRPSVERNAFPLLIAALKNWRSMQNDIHEWTIYSIGEEYDDIYIGNGCCIKSLGKLTLEQYAKTLLHAYAGISLMISPHPSYVPLEMATFGLKTITNRYENKDLSSFNSNIISLSVPSPQNIAFALNIICNNFDGKGIIKKDISYVQSSTAWKDILQDLPHYMFNENGKEV